MVTTPSLSISIDTAPLLCTNNLKADEEISGQHQEQDGPLEHIRKAGVHLCKGGGGHGGPVLKHGDQGGHHKDDPGVQLGQPGHDDPRPAHIVGEGGGEDAHCPHLEGGSQAGTYKEEL